MEKLDNHTGCPARILAVWVSKGLQRCARQIAQFYSCFGGDEMAEDTKGQF